jgi:hypothetical protein
VSAGRPLVYQLSPGKGGYPHRCSARAQQRGGRGANGSAGGEDVVDQKDMLAGDSCPVCNGECAADVHPAPTGGEAGLALRGAQAHQAVGGEAKLPRWVGLAQETQSVLSERPGLIESALGLFGMMKRNGDDEHGKQRLIGQAGDGLGEHATQHRGRGMQTLIFEGMDGVAHAVLVEAEGDGAKERRRSEAADAAPRGIFGICAGRRNVEGIAAAAAENASLEGKFKPAG